MPRRRRRPPGPSRRRAGLALALALGCAPRASTPELSSPPSDVSSDADTSETPSPEAPRLDALRLLGLLDALASDELGGRFTLHDDIRRAAETITARYREAGVAPGTPDGYLVDFEIVVGVDAGPELGLAIGRGDELRAVDPSSFVPRPEGAAGRVEGPAVFVGHAIVQDGDEEPFDELAGVPLSGAVAVVLAGAPPGGMTKAGLRPRFDFDARNLARKLERLAEAGAAAVIVVDESASELPRFDEPRPIRGRVPIPVFELSAEAAHARWPQLASRRKKLERSQQPQSGPLRGRVRVDADVTPRVVRAPNVLAMVPGTDLADEIVIVGAHYDHLGTAEAGHGSCHAMGDASGELDRVCNGADDNASGSAIVAELAMSWSAASERPRRTVVFVHFAGEEMGLLGSRDLAAHLDTLPPFSGRRVVAMLNVDMVGRLRERLTVSGLGSSPAWMEILDEVGPGAMTVLYDRSLTTRSDHAPFFERGIPTLFFFTELHDEYHSPADESSGIVRDGVVSVAHLVDDIASVVAEGRAVPFASSPDPNDGLVRWLPGQEPSTVVKIVGPASPAAP